MKNDYYHILGINKNASDAEIKKAYRQMALKYHPDKNREPGAEATFKKIAEAYDVLSDKDKKRTYDQFGEDGLKNGGSGGFGGGGMNYEFRGDPMDIFKQFFGTEDPYGPGGPGMFDLGGDFGGPGTFFFNSKKK